MADSVKVDISIIYEGFSLLSVMTIYV